MIPFRTLSIFCLCLLFVSNVAHAQFSQVMGMDTSQSLANFDRIFGSVLMPNGNIWISGRIEKTQTSSGGQVGNYGILVQLSPAGYILSSQKSGFKSVNTLDVTADGNLLIGGEGSGFVCTSGMCKSDMLVAKVTTGYSVLWGRSFGNPNYNGSDGLKRVFETADSNIVVVGNIYESSNNSHPFIAKLNGDNGDTLWTLAPGYPSNQFGNDASEGPNGELFLGVSGDLRVFKISSTGQLAWSKGFANYGQVKRVFAQADGSVIAVGQYLSAGGSYNTCMFKISDAGTLLWFHDYNTALPNHDEMINDAIFYNGNFYLGGYQYSASTFTGMYPLLVKTDTLGNILWSMTSPNPDGEIKTVMAVGANILFGIEYYPPVPNNRPDILLIQTDQATGTNSCLISHPLTTGSPTITTSTNGSWAYTDFETQNTPIGFSYQAFWKTTQCLSTAIEPSPESELFSIVQNDETLLIQPGFNEPYSIEITDLSGRRIFYNENYSGEQSVTLNKNNRGVLLVRLMSGNGMLVRKFFVN